MNLLKNTQKKAVGKWLNLQRPQYPLTNERGAYITLTAITMSVMIGLAAFGIEIGRWYAIQGELGKAIDAAAFAGAKNVNNPNIPDIRLFAGQVANANFPPGLLGTETPSFSISDDGNGKVFVVGQANSLNTLSKAINPDFGKTKVATSGSARLRNAEIALVLDASGSMRGTPMTRLKDGANAFVENFEDKESKNKFALISFASGAIKDFDLEHDYVSPLNTAITALEADGFTNAEDALGQASALPWKDQSSIPRNEQDKQVVVFFSDGNPTAFRGQFTHRNNTYDAVAAVTAAEHFIWELLLKSDEKDTTYNNINTVHLTGDGKPKGISACSSLDKHTVKWEIFSDPTYGLDQFGATSGIDPETCGIISPDPLGDYANWLVRQMAIDHAADIKAQGIEIYTIGLGDVDRTYLDTLSSGPNFSYYTSDANELEGIFQEIANILKLVLTS